MRSENANPNPSANGGRKAPKSLKAYHTPEFRILAPAQAAAELRAKSLPGDAGARQLLKIATELSQRRRA